MGGDVTALVQPRPPIGAPPARPCPTGGALNLAGEHFPCEQMDAMDPGATDHDGWSHANRAAQAIWS